MRTYVDRVILVFKWIGAAAIAGMMFLTCLDVILRAAGRPIFGAVEIVGFMATIGVACSLPYTHQQSGHVGVDMLIRRLSPRAQGVVDFITNSAAMILFAVVSWRCFVYGENLRKTGEVSMTLEFPAYIFVYFLGVAFAALCLAILVQVADAGRQAVQK
jgi:TRAP-type C4-dicarboxylate transport system permease small subunit